MVIRILYSRYENQQLSSRFKTSIRIDLGNAKRTYRQCVSVPPSRTLSPYWGWGIPPTPVTNPTRRGGWPFSAPHALLIVKFAVFIGARKCVVRLVKMHIRVFVVKFLYGNMSWSTKVYRLILKRKMLDARVNEDRFVTKWLSDDFEFFPSWEEMTMQWGPRNGSSAFTSLRHKVLCVKIVSNFDSAFGSRDSACFDDFQTSLKKDHDSERYDGENSTPFVLQLC